LEKRGHLVVVAQSTREALATLEQQRVDVVLMDLDMPEVDGAALTAHIRQRQADHGVLVKVVGMGAHPLDSGRVRWREMAIDTWIAMPWQPKALVETVEGAVRLPSHQTTRMAMTPGQRVEEPFDRAEILARVDGDEHLLTQLTELFLNDCPQLVTQIHEAAARRDSKALERAVHALHLSASPFSTRAVDEAALRLEAMARSHPESGIEEACAVLEAELERLSSSLARFKKDMGRGGVGYSGQAQGFPVSSS
jgi:CheY-like chemotaxis protein